MKSTPPSLAERIFRETFGRKFLWLTALTCLVAALIIILPRVPTPAPAVDSKLLAIRALFGLMLALAAFNWRLLVRPPWQFADTLFAGLLASFVVSAVLSGRMLYCLSEWWHLAGFYGLGWLMYRLRPTVRESLALLQLTGLLGFVAALYGFSTYIGWDILKTVYPFEYETGQGGRNFIHSFYGNPEYFGGVAAPTAVVLLGLALQASEKAWRRIGFAGAAAFIMLVLLLSGSRSAVLGSAVGAAVVFLGQVRLLSRKLQRASWLMVGAALLVGVIGLTVFSTPNPINRRDMRLAQRFTTIFETSSASTRERLLFYTSAAMAIPHNFSWGYGPGTYRLEFYGNVKLLADADDRAGTTMLLNDLDRRLAEHTHNDYLEFWFEYGTVGFALILLLICHGGVSYARARWQVRRTRLSADGIQATSTMVLLFAASATMLVNAVTSFPLHMPARGTLAWILIGAYFASERLLSETVAGTEDKSTQAPLTQ